MSHTVLISGCHAGPNPSPGLGIARSLRLAFPRARLIARDFSSAASGLHDPVFDETWLCPAWGEMDLDIQWSQLLERLEGGWFISGLDLEVKWLAARDHLRILAPPAPALVSTSKPAIAAAAHLPVRVPDWLPLGAGDREVHRFCRAHGWRVWLKGPAYEAIRVCSWPELRAGVASLETTWGEENLFVQVHVAGQGASIAFAALKGQLLDAVLLEKLDVTPLGKVWAGNIKPLDQGMESALEDVLSTLNWTGGGELEFIRDRAGSLWLIDWNPRFPAWVHGATFAGHNLPGGLLAEASGYAADPPVTVSEGFIRVVMEVPVRSGIPLLPRMSTSEAATLAEKHPSGMPQLAKRLPPAQVQTYTAADVIEPELRADLRRILGQDAETPSRVHLRRTAENNFSRMHEVGQELGIRVAYSVKTNPDPEFMAMSRRCGFMAEAISGRELEWAVSSGWPPSEIIYNGPVPLVAAGVNPVPLAAAFADSVPAFIQYAEQRVGAVVGVRLRPPFCESRFGVPLNSPEEFQSLAEALRRISDLPFGISLHLPSSDIGIGRWEQLAGWALDFGEALEQVAGRHVELVDFGGGWSPDDMEPMRESLSSLSVMAKSRFTRLEAIVFEPGKLLVQSAQAMLTRAVEVRTSRHGGREVVVDASLGDLPMVNHYPHRCAVLRHGEVILLRGGVDRLLGRTCMEHDVLANAIQLPADFRAGDVVAFCDAGAYDASMAYAFGTAGVR